MSKTTLSGLAGLLILVVALLLLAFGRIDAVGAALLIVTLGGAASSIGLITAKDHTAPETLASVEMTQRKPGGKATLSIAATPQQPKKDEGEEDGAA